MTLSEQMVEFANAPVGVRKEASKEEAIEVVDALWKNTVLIEWLPKVTLLEDELARREGLQDRIFTWGRETFGPSQRSGGVFAHLAREIKELGKSLPKLDPVELADCTILLFELAGFAGADLLKEVEKKFKINQDRKWGPMENNDSILHLEEDECDD